MAWPREGPVPRSETVVTRLTPDERADLEDWAAERSLPLSKAVRRCIGARFAAEDVLEIADEMLGQVEEMAQEVQDEK